MKLTALERKAAERLLFEHGYILTRKELESSGVPLPATWRQKFNRFRMIAVKGILWLSPAVSSSEKIKVSPSRELGTLIALKEI